MGSQVTASKNGNTLVVRFAGPLTAGNAQVIQDKILELSAREPHDLLELDLSETEYVTSAGLRMFLFLHKKEKLVLSGVSSVVYEVLEITGFNQIMDIHRAVRKVSLENAACIGSGFFSRVYRLDDETIVKVFVRDSAEEDIRREAALDKYALLMGLPTAISFDLVEADGKKGIIFEMMNSGTLQSAMAENPDRFEAYLDKYAALLRELHETTDLEKRLPDARKRLLDSMEIFRDLYTETEFSSLKSLLKTVPESDNFIHGDCHIKNIMLHNDEPLLIDLDTLSRGNPVIELGNLYFTYIIFDEIWPGNTPEFLGTDRAADIYYGMLQRYFSDLDEAMFSGNMERIRVVGYTRMLAFLKEFKSGEKDAILRVRDSLIRCASSCSTLRLTGRP